MDGPLNITSESLFLGFDKAVKAVMQRYSKRRSENGGGK